MTASPTRRFNAAALTFVIVSISFVLLADQASSQTAESFRDNFNSISYSGNNGTINWSGSWQESGEGDGPASGSVQVTASDRCSGGSGNCLRIGSDGGNLNNHGAYRTANLDNAVSATLSFSYRRQTQGQVAGSITVQVSGNGGSSWSTLTTIALAGPQKASTATFNVSGYMGPSTVVRFRGSGTGINGYLHVDAVEVTADMAPPNTTTTVATTTIPGTPTTTTTSGTPTSTVPGSPTTTTIPGTPTTTAPGTPTTTTMQGTPTTTLPDMSSTTVSGTPTTTAVPGAPTTNVAGSPTTTSAASTTPGMTPTTTSPPDAPDEATASAADAFVDSQDESRASEDLAPMAIAVETISANAVTVVILALVASGLAFVGIDRPKRQPTTDTDTDADPEAP
jgi:hypothetical protein